MGLVLKFKSESIFIQDRKKFYPAFPVLSSYGLNPDLIMHVLFIF